VGITEEDVTIQVGTYAHVDSYVYTSTGQTHLYLLINVWILAIAKFIIVLDLYKWCLHVLLEIAKAYNNGILYYNGIP